MTVNRFDDWAEEFSAEKERRAVDQDPLGISTTAIPMPIWRSIQRFQIGESGDGRNLIAKADEAGDPSYSAAVRMFVAEEQNHARLLALLLESAGQPLLRWHWSDWIFVRLRRLLGLRLELLVLMVAEVVALEYYRTLRDTAPDPGIRFVAGRILQDEQRHVPFHSRRLRDSFEELPRPTRRPVMWCWRMLLRGASVLVAVTHGTALRAMNLSAASFQRGVMDHANQITNEILGRRQITEPNLAPATQQ
jgi:hypothetical protein